MRHTVEDLSPVKKKIAVTLLAADVDAVLDRITSGYRSRVVLPGFRKGKAPLSMVGKRFAQDIHSDAASELITRNIDDILREMELEPLSGVHLESDLPTLSRGKDFTYSFTFEVMPVIDLPAYEGIGVEQDEATVSEEEITQVIDRVRRNMAERIPVTEKRLPADGDIVTMDFSGFDQDGLPVPGVSGEDFSVSLGEKQVIPDFEALARTVAPGDSGEGAVRFPDDYGNENLAGRTLTVKLTVTSLEERKLPEFDDEFAKKAGGFESVEAMRGNVRDSYLRNRTEMARAKAQSLLLEGLLQKTSFPLPEDMLERYTNNLIHGRHESLAAQGKDLNTLPEAEQEEIKAAARKEAEQYAKTQLFLLTVAKREKLETTPQEMTAALRQIAIRGGHDIKDVQAHYVRNNLFPALRDRLLADKAMDAIYAKAAPEQSAKDAGQDGERATTPVGKTGSEDVSGDASAAE